ncbi:hypothetical protein C6499_22475 [Candidatus Poribacteria bacterium]|nr:MAG: hypothetical protein C6499_22475 [Candidatus Poribacteria bacterium]
MYDYIGQGLNRPIAEKLILELFSGSNMVPRKKIIKDVHDTHVQRGGDPIDDPTSVVRGALDNLLNEGIATRAKGGYYSIHQQNPPEQPEPVGEDEVNRLRSVIENEVEFVDKQINQLERRKSELSCMLDEL